MRKLIVLVMTSVLATGAVANADQTNVIEDADTLIAIGGITDGTEIQARSGVVDNTSILTPGIGSRDKYTIRGDVRYERDNGVKLVQVGVCLYDTREANDATAAGNLCGYGLAETDLDATKDAIGFDLPEKALQATIKLDGNGTVQSLAIDHTNEHVTGTGIGSQISRDPEFNSDSTVEGIDFGVTVQLSHALAAGTDAYTVRVAAIYEDNSVFTLIDTRTYSVAEYRSIDTSRTSVNYGDVIPGGAPVGEDDITTGNFYANHSVDVKFDASKFKLDPADTEEAGIDFASSTSLSGADADKFALECILDSGTVGTDEFMVTDGTTTIISGQLGSNTIGDSEALTTLDTHDCDLYAGIDVPIGSYSNTIDVLLASAGS